jgi:HEPN domain-containing protein
MTTHDLAKDYFKRAQMRFAALGTLLNEGAYPDVIRESQELVELVLKGYLRLYNIDPPKWHDVGSILVQNASLLSVRVQTEMNFIVEFSKFLRRERENAFYGDDDLIPTDHFTKDMADDCYAKVKKLLEIFKPEFNK